jgi:hypothetical protein
MLHATNKKSEQKRNVRFPGICAAAKALGVTREHLYRVLTGERHSASLSRRYHSLQKKP